MRKTMEEMNYNYQKLEDIKVDSPLKKSVMFKPKAAPIICFIIGVPLMFVGNFLVRLLGDFFIIMALIVFKFVEDRKVIDIFEKGCIIYHPRDNTLGYYLKYDDIKECEKFLPYVDNWAVCDIMSPKVFKKHKTEQKNILKNCAHVVKCNIKNGDKNYPSGKSALVITFDKSMQPGVALGFSDSGGEFLNLDESVRDAVSWSDDQKTITIKLDLKANTHYAFSIMGEKFLTQDGHNAGETQYIDFWTK